MRGGLAGALVLSVMLYAGAAAADAVPPPPTDCVPGSKGDTCHGGPHCRPRICSNDDACASGESCQALRLCIDQIDCGGLGGPSLGDQVTGACDSGACSQGSCQTVMVCAPASTTSTTGATTGGGPAAGAGGGDDGGPTTRVDQGCGCRKAGGSRDGNAAALVALGALLFVRRRRMGR